MPLDHQASAWAIRETGNCGGFPIFFLFGSACLFFLRSFDKLRAATDGCGKEKNHDYRLYSYHLILHIQEEAV